MQLYYNSLCNHYEKSNDYTQIHYNGIIILIIIIKSLLCFWNFHYSLGLRLGEGLRLEVGDIDAHRQRVHIRDAKGNKDRLVPLPAATLERLRRFWQGHRNPRRRFPHRHGGLKAAHRASRPLDRGGV